MSVLLKALLFGTCIGAWGVVLCVSPWGLFLEESLGLGLLFRIRGRIDPPTEVVIIGIDQASARRLKLNHKPQAWPRGLHTQLLRRLTEAGAQAVAFDIIFDEPRNPRQDEAFAAAIADAGNVVLVEVLRKERLSIDGGANQLEIETLDQPIDVLSDAALALAPFPIPKVPVKVSQYWTFKTGAGSIPSFPVVVFQAYALEAYEALVSVLRTEVAGLPVDIPTGRSALVQAGRMEGAVRMVRDHVRTALAENVRERLSQAAETRAKDDRSAELLRRLIEMYTAPASLYLNFYGPPGTIRTLSYHELVHLEQGRPLVKALPELAGKAVFIGMSEREVPVKTDGFYTVYSQPNGVDLNGVEIAATAFANILENNPIRPMAAADQMALVGGCGLILGMICRLISTIKAGLGMTAFGLAFAWVSTDYFTHEGLWLPVVTIVFVQVPTAYIIGVVLRYVDVDRERKAILRAFRFYLPRQIVDQIAAEREPITANGRMVYGTFLCTDLGKYTTYSERTDPSNLHQLMHAYYETLFEPLRRNGGFVSDITGDCMMGLWASPRRQPDHRRRACEAALQIKAALSEFWSEKGRSLYLPTRMGLHYGPVHLGNVGANPRYVYQATGDTVNTVARIENLNKHLGTQILVTRDVLVSFDQFLTRYLGTFLLSGKSNPVKVHELVGHTKLATAHQQDLCARFTAGLEAYVRRDWEAALRVFQAIARSADGDGPTRFYINLCQQHLSAPPPEDWDGVIVVGKR